MAYNNAKISGRVIMITDTQTSASGFCWREMVIETGGQWSNPVPTRWIRDNTTKLDGLKPGDEVTVEYRLNGREYNGKYYVDVQGLAIVGGDAPAKSANAEPTTAEVEAAFANDDPDNIPF